MFFYGGYPRYSFRKNLTSRGRLCELYEGFWEKRVTWTVSWLVHFTIVHNMHFVLLVLFFVFEKSTTVILFQVSSHLRQFLPPVIALETMLHRQPRLLAITRVFNVRIVGFSEAATAPP